MKYSEEEDVVIVFMGILKIRVGYCNWLLFKVDIMLELFYKDLFFLGKEC